MNQWATWDTDVDRLSSQASRMERTFSLPVDATGLAWVMSNAPLSPPADRSRVRCQLMHERNQAVALLRPPSPGAESSWQ